MDEARFEDVITDVDKSARNPPVKFEQVAPTDEYPQRGGGAEKRG